MDIQSVKNNLGKWFGKSYHAKPFIDLAVEKEVPTGKHFIWYYTGGIAFFLLVIQIVTGILLLFYYKPTEAAAFDSVKFIMEKAEYGWLIRSSHAWSANLMVFMVFVHLFANFFLRAYRPPRELTWVTGVILLALTMGAGFTGYLLPWNELSFFATKVGTQIAGSVPVVGELTRTILRGGEEVSDATLGRFFGFHIILIPLILLGLVGLHMLMVQLQGMSTPIPKSGAVKNKNPKKAVPFFPNFMLRDLAVWAITLGIVVSLAVYLPAELGKKVDPFAPTPMGIKPEWYFLWMFQALKLIPSKVFIFDGEVVGILCFGAIGVIAAMLPYLDIWSRKEKQFSFLTFLGIGMLIFIVAMTIWGLVI